MMSICLMRELVCNLLVQLFLGLVRAVTLESESRGTHGHILLSHLRFPHPGRPGPSIYILKEQGGPVTLPGTGYCYCCVNYYCGDYLATVVVYRGIIYQWMLYMYLL
jgi:hypothetical protein